MSAAPDGTPYADLTALARDAALAAGRLIVDGRPRRVEVAATKSSPTDVVTEMDRASEVLLREHLLGARPGDGLLGEEGGDVRGTSGVTWVVDPIDGTVNYLYGIPAYCVSVAAVEGDPREPSGHRVLAGCVHNPVSGETWTATRDGGAELDGRPLRMEEPGDLSQVLLATGFGYDVRRRARQAQVVAALLPQVRDIRRMGSAALDLCALATGRVDAYVERGLNPWDLAAGELVVTEAGGRVGGLGEAAASSELVVACAPGLWDDLQQVLAPLDPASDG